jgi:hypothetical protein
VYRRGDSIRAGSTTRVLPAGPRAAQRRVLDLMGAETAWMPRPAHATPVEAELRAEVEEDRALRRRRAV